MIDQPTDGIIILCRDCDFNSDHGCEAPTPPKATELYIHESGHIRGCSRGQIG